MYVLLSAMVKAQHRTAHSSTKQTVWRKHHRHRVLCLACVLQGVLQRVLSEGHDLGSHTAQHLFLTNLTATEVEQQLQWAISNISMITNSTMVPVSELLWWDTGGLLGPHML